MRQLKEIIAVGVMVFAVFVPDYCQGMEMVIDGKPKAKIIIVSDACRMVEYAAEELQTYLEKISGAKLPIEKVAPETKVTINKNENYIFVGESPYTKKLGIKVSNLKQDGFRMIARDNWLALVGRDYKGETMTGLDRWFSLNETYNRKSGISIFGETGTLYSVYRFLENHLGVRWFMPGELGEVVPMENSIEVKNMNYQEAPDFTYRRLYFAYGFDGEKFKDMVRWYRRAGFGADFPVEALHSFKYFVKKHFKTHPEYFYNYGKTRYPHLVLTEPGVLEQFVKDIREYFDAHPERRIYPVMPDDMNLDRDIEKDERLKGVDDPSMGREGRFSDYLWTFVNNVAKEIYKTHPDKLIACCAYSDYVTPPKTIKRLNPNVAVMIAKARANYNDPQKKKKINGFVKEWKKKCDNIYIWEYYNWYYCGGVLPGTPKFFPHIIADDLKFLKGISRGESIEAETVSPPLKAAHHIMTHLNYYVTARYFWDADQDIEKLLSDYYEKFYGPAKDEMRRFYTRAEELHMNKEDVKKHGEELVGYLKEAKEKAGDTIYGKRVDLMLSEASLMLKKGIISDFPCVPFGRKKEEVKEKGLAAYWNFDEGEGKIVKDSSGNGNHGKVHNTKWLNTDYGSSLEFNGKNSYVEIPYPKENLALKRKITLMGWFYCTERSKNVGLIWTHNYAYALELRSGSIRCMLYGEKGGASRGCRCSQQYLTVPGWNYIAGTYDADSRKVKLYHNGELKTTYPFAGNIRYAGDGKTFTNFKLYIGERSDLDYTPDKSGSSPVKGIYGSEWQGRFRGRIDEVKIYSRAFSDEEIKTEFERGREAFLKH